MNPRFGIPSVLLHLATLPDHRDPVIALTASSSGGGSLYGQYGCLHQWTTRGCCVSQPWWCFTEPQSPGGGSGGAPGVTQQQPGPGSAQQLVQNVIHEQGSGAFPRTPHPEYAEVLIVPLKSMPLWCACNTSNTRHAIQCQNNRETHHSSPAGGTHQLKCGVLGAGIIE
jgi:hypothetical protein